MKLNKIGFILKREIKMVKVYFLSENPITHQYDLVRGAFERDRINLGLKFDDKRICNKLKGLLPLHKKIILYTEKSLDSGLKSCLETIVKGLRIEIKYVTDIKYIKMKNKYS